MNPNLEMLVLARESRGLSQSGLADRLGTTQGYVSKMESGVKPITDELLPRIAEALSYPVTFFHLSDRVYGYGTPCLYHRRQKSISAAVLRQLQAIANVTRFQVRGLASGVDIETADTMPRLDPDEFGTPENIAGVLRLHWRLPSGPVRNLVRVIESSGGIIVRMPFGTRRLDAVSIWAPGEWPLFLINRDSPWDRIRFTLAHEVGHLVMHTEPTPDMEREADRFAAEFLMPEDEIKGELRGLDLSALAILKQRWRVSMAALARRASDTEAITRDQYRRLLTLLGKLGYRLNEPNPISPEDPTVLRDILRAYLSDSGMSLEELASKARCPVADLRERFLAPAVHIVGD